MIAMLTPQQLAERLVAQMTLDEKLSLVQGSPAPSGVREYVGLVRGIERLGVPDLRMQDGPQGFRCIDHKGTSTQWPSMLTVARTFSEFYMRKWGSAMGVEFAGKGANVQLGPGVNGGAHQWWALLRVFVRRRSVLGICSCPAGRKVYPEPGSHLQRQALDW